MSDNSQIKIMQSLGLDYSKAILSTMHFEKSIQSLNKQLANMKSIATQNTKDINTVFASQLGQVPGDKTIVNQYGNAFKVAKSEAEKMQSSLKDNLNLIKQSNLEKMKAQAALVQQRASSKELGNEYIQQSGTIREQLSLIQARLQSEGKLTAEEVRQTKELKEQLDILNAQSRTDVHDKSRLDSPTPNEFKDRASWFTDGAKFYAVSKAAKEANGTIKEVEMGMVDIQRVMSDSSFVFEDYRDELLKLGVDYGQTFENAQNIALRWAQSGYNVADSLELTETSLLALNAAELDAKSATESMIGIMAQWNLEAQDLELIMDKINKTADTHSATSQDLVDGLLRSSGAARTMNLSIEETIALLVNMREASGRTGREVGNALSSIISYMQRPAAIKAIEGAGISMFADEAKTQFRSVIDIFEDMSVQWNVVGDDLSKGFLESADSAEFFNEELAVSLGMQEEWNDLQKRDVSQAAAGVHRRNFLIGLMERMGNTQKALNGMMDAGGYSMEKNAQTMETLEKKQESLKTSVKALQVAMGDAGLEGALKGLADGGTTAINAINDLPKPMKDLTLSAMSTFTAVKSLEWGMKTFGIKLPGIYQMIGSLTSGTISLTAAFKAGAAGVSAFVTANAPLLALSAVVGVIFALTNAWKKHREEQEKAIEVAKENIQSYEEQRQGLVELSKEYDILKSKEENLTTTADEKQRLIEIQRELVELYGVSADGIDREGKSYANSTEAIYARIGALDELKKAEEGNLEKAVKQSDSSARKMLEKAVDERENYIKKLQLVNDEIKELENDLTNRTIATIDMGYGSVELDASLDGDRETLLFHLESLYEARGRIDDALDDINDTVKESSRNRFKFLREHAIGIAEQIGSDNDAVADSLRLYGEHLAKTLAETTDNIFDLKDNLEAAMNNLMNSNFVDMVEDYQKAMVSGNDEAIKKTSQAIVGFAEDLTRTNPELEEFALGLVRVFGAGGPVDEGADKLENLTNSTSQMTEKMKQLIDSFNDSTSALQSYYSMLDEVNSKEGLSAKSKEDIINKYHELLPYLSDEAELRNQLIDIIAREEETQRRAYEDIIMNSKDFYNVRIKGNAELVDSLNKYYNTDFNNFKSLADAKGRVEAELVKQLSGTWADYYGVIKRGNVNAMIAMEQQAMQGSKAAQQILDTHRKVAEMEGHFRSISLNLGGIDFRGLSRSGIKGTNTPKGSTSSKTSDKEGRYENKELEHAIKLLEHRKRISEETHITIQSELEELNRINKEYVKTEEERMNMAERIYAAEKRLRDATFQHSVNWINEKKNLDELSAEREIYLWEKVRRTQYDNIEARKQAELNLHKLRNQLRTENLNKEESTIKHLTKLGVYSVQEQIDAYKRLYSIKANSLDEERNRVENLFSLYKSLLAEQQRKIKDAYDDRIRQIESEANAKKAMQDDVIRGIEAELKLLDRQEQAYDHDKKMADLKEQLAYWQVRTSEDARKKVAELLKQIDEVEHDREIELKKQGLEDKKQIAQDEVKAIDEAAKKERENWEKSYKLVEKSFDDHSTNIIALASTMSKEAYSQWESNYLIPLQDALASADFNAFDSISWGLGDALDDFPSWDDFDSDWGTSPTVHDWGMSDADYKRFKENGWRWAELQAQGYKQATNAEMERLNADNDALRVKYGRDPALGEKPKFHQGAKTLSYGVAEFMPGELVFPPDLSTRLESLIDVLYQRPINQSSNSLTDNRKEIKIDKLLNIEKNYMEDEIDGDIFSRQLQRQLTSFF